MWVATYPHPPPELLLYLRAGELPPQSPAISYRPARWLAFSLIPAVTVTNKVHAMQRHTKIHSLTTNVPQSAAGLHLELTIIVRHLELWRLTAAVTSGYCRPITVRFPVPKWW